MPDSRRFRSCVGRIICTGIVLTFSSPLPSLLRATGAGLGLISIDERVRLLRGSVNIETERRCGTRVEVRIPQPQADALGRDASLDDPAFAPSALEA